MKAIDRELLPFQSDTDWYHEAQRLNSLLHATFEHWYTERSMLARDRRITLRFAVAGWGAALWMLVLGLSG